MITAALKYIDITHIVLPLISSEIIHPRSKDLLVEDIKKRTYTFCFWLHVRVRNFPELDLSNASDPRKATCIRLEQKNLKKNHNFKTESSA